MNNYLISFSYKTSKNYDGKSPFEVYERTEVVQCSSIDIAFGKLRDKYEGQRNAIGFTVTYVYAEPERNLWKELREAGV